MSYYAKYHSTEYDKPLLGGILEAKSSRFESKLDAQTRLQQAIEMNGEHCEGKIIKTGLYPEIFSHCRGFTPQVISGRCFGCGKVLTVADAKKRERENGILDDVIKRLTEYYPGLSRIDHELRMKIEVPDTNNDQCDYKTTLVLVEKYLDDTNHIRRTTASSTQ